MEDKSNRDSSEGRRQGNEEEHREEMPLEEDVLEDYSVSANLPSTEVDQISGWTFDSRRFLVKRIGRPVQLSNFEFYILRHLAARPYWAFTRKQIAKGVSQMLDEEAILEEEAVDEHVVSLRDKLGMLSDHIQSVPYVGYRFKE